MNWIIATAIAFVIVIAVFVFSKWLEKKNYSQQLELLSRKKGRLREKAEAGEGDGSMTKESEQPEKENS